MTKFLISAVILYLGTALSLSGQCYPDRHNTSASSAWISCETSPNPNPARGESHWIAYDLGESTRLGQMTIWNTNNPASLESGAKTIEVDYSQDGINWTFFQSFEVPMGQASSFYEGDLGLDFENLTATHLLLTITENYGGDCYGFSELKIERFDPVSTDDLQVDNSMDLYPSPAIDHVFINYESPISNPATITVLDMAGAEIRSQQARLLTGANRIRVDLEGLPSGQYYIRLKSATQLLTGELTIIQN